MDKQLAELVERLEGAEGGSRELDARIAVAIRYGLPPLNPLALGQRYVRLPTPNDEAAAGTYWVSSSRGGLSLWTAPEFTTSLDAALLLPLPEGWTWEQLTWGKDWPRCSARAGNWGGADNYRTASSEICATAALALTAACLRARAEREK